MDRSYLPFHCKGFFMDLNETEVYEDEKKINAILMENYNIFLSFRQLK